MKPFLPSGKSVTVFARAVAHAFTTGCLQQCTSTMAPARTVGAILCIAFVINAEEQAVSTTSTTTTTTVGRLEPTTLDLGVNLPVLTDPAANTQIFVDLMKV